MCSRTSTRSSTSDGRGRQATTRRLVGLVRLTHPFPISLDALATAGIALIAGASAGRAMVLGLGMLALQGSIGALNDVFDGERDAGRKPGKPIPAGLVGRRWAVVVALALAAIGLILGGIAGPGAGAVGIAILLIGWSYDAWFKGTPWSWLPFAVGIPLLPVYAWVGAAGSLPGLFAVLVPAAFLAGTALAISNSLVDVERDRSGGVTSIAAHVGPAFAWRIHVVLHAGVWLIAIASLVALDRLIVLATAGLGLAGAVIGGGAILAASPLPGRRERGWELEAIGVALLAAGWFVAIRA